MELTTIVKRVFRLPEFVNGRVQLARDFSAGAVEVMNNKICGTPPIPLSLCQLRLTSTTAKPPASVSGATSACRDFHPRSGAHSHCSGSPDR